MEQISNNDDSPLTKRRVSIQSVDTKTFLTPPPSSKATKKTVRFLPLNHQNSFDSTTRSATSSPRSALLRYFQQMYRMHHHHGGLGSLSEKSNIVQPAVAAAAANNNNRTANFYYGSNSSCEVLLQQQRQRQFEKNDDETMTESANEDDDGKWAAPSVIVNKPHQSYRGAGNSMRQSAYRRVHAAESNGGGSDHYFNIAEEDLHNNNHLHHQSSDFHHHLDDNNQLSSDSSTTPSSLLRLQHQHQDDDAVMLDFIREAMKNLPQMQYRYLGRTGVPVSVLALQIGQWIGNSGEILLPERNIEKILHAAYHAGINVYDVSTGRGSLPRAEALLGSLLERLKWRRSSFLVCCQVQACGSSLLELAVNRKSIIESCNATVQRLNLNHIDVLYVPSPRHPLSPPPPVVSNNASLRVGGGAERSLTDTDKPPPMPPLNYFSTYASIEEIVRACSFLVNSGKILHWACHDWGKRELLEAFTVARTCQLVAPSVVRSRYDFFHRENVEIGFAELQLQIGFGIIALSQLNACGVPSSSPPAVHKSMRTLTSAAEATSTVTSPLPSPRGLTAPPTANATGGFFKDDIHGSALSLALPANNSLAVNNNPTTPPPISSTNEADLHQQEKLVRAVKMKRLSNYVETHFQYYQLKQLELAWCLRMPQVHCMLIGVNSIEMLRHAIEALFLTPQIVDVKRLLEIENILFNSPLAKLSASLIQQHNALLYTQSITTQASMSTAFQGTRGEAIGPLTATTVEPASTSKKKERKKSTSRMSLHESNPYQSDPTALPVAPVAARARRMSMY